MRTIQKTHLWVHVIENTKHAPPARTWWYVTKVVSPLDFSVPESAGKLNCNLRKKDIKCVF